MTFRSTCSLLVHALCSCPLSSICAHDGCMLTRESLAQGLGIDVGAVALFAFLVRRDLAARDKQMARLLREEKLGALQLELANRKASLTHLDKTWTQFLDQPSSHYEVMQECIVSP